MTLMIGLHHFFLEMYKNVGQDYVSGTVQCHSRVQVFHINFSKGVDSRQDR
jgi:hypothetical protein